MGTGKRVVEVYRGVTLVATIYRGVFQGKAWESPGHALAHVEGESILDVLTKLRKRVDSPEVQERFKRELLAKHGRFLQRKGIDASNISAQKITQAYQRTHRETGCYDCRSTIDNEVDLECSQCSWIICGECGACGCGHPEYGPKFHPRRSRPTDDDPWGLDEPRTYRFKDYAAALECTRKHPGAKLRRSPTDDGWLVIL